jgi:hypothetical protein
MLSITLQIARSLTMRKTKIVCCFCTQLTRCHSIALLLWTLLYLVVSHDARERIRYTTTAFTTTSQTRLTNHVDCTIQRSRIVNHHPTNGFCGAHPTHDMFYYCTSTYNHHRYTVSKLFDSTNHNTEDSIPLHEQQKHNDNLLEQLNEPFDRWRFLQKVLDEDINDASDILFVLQTSMRQQQQDLQAREQERYSCMQQQLLTSALVATSSLSVGKEALESYNSTSIVAIAPLTSTEIIAPTTILLNDYEYDNNNENTIRRQVCDVSVGTIQNLLRPESDDKATSNVIATEEMRVLDLFSQLLPNPDIDEDAAKGLWDTIIELHGRESVKINEQKQYIGWKTRCYIVRLLIYYDFLTVGFQVRKST